MRPAVAVYCFKNFIANHISVKKCKNNKIQTLQQIARMFNSTTIVNYKTIVSLN